MVGAYSAQKHLFLSILLIFERQCAGGVAMATQGRRERMLDYMREAGGFVTVEQLCARLFVSGATVRRDLAELESSRLIRRTRGGAMLLDSNWGDEPLGFRENKNVMQKQAIAGLARAHIRDGMTLFMDSSSTVGVLAGLLDEFQGLKVITNGLKTAYLLSERKNVSVMCTGGTVRDNSQSLVGQSAVGFIGRLNADLAFISCRGFSIANGASEASEEEFYIKRQFLHNSAAAVLLCDSAKMDIDYLCRVAPLSRFVDVITERRELNNLCRAAMTAG